MRFVSSILLLMVLIPMIFAIGSGNDFNIDLDNFEIEELEAKPPKPVPPSWAEVEEQEEVINKILSFVFFIFEGIAYLVKYVVYVGKYIYYLTTNIFKIFRFSR